MHGRTSSQAWKSFRCRSLIMSYGSPEITYEDIKCEECGRYLKKIESKHLKTHGLTIAEYKEKWGFCRNQPLEAIYIKEIRREKTIANKTYENLKDTREDNKFKKGHKNYWSNNPVREQMRRRLENMSVNVQSTSEFRELQKCLVKHRQRDKATGQFVSETTT